LNQSLKKIKKEKKDVFFWFYCRVTLEKKIFAGTVFVAPIPSVQFTLIFMVGIGVRKPNPIPFGAPTTVKF
jgi:hypothetical protein